MIGKRIIAIIVSLFFIESYGQTQAHQEVFQRIVDFHKTLDAFETIISVRLESETGVVELEQVSELRKMGEMAFVRSGPIELMNNRMYFVKVDHQNKVLMLSHADGEEELPQQLDQMDSILQAFRDRMTVSSNATGYRIVIPELMEDMKAAEFYFRKDYTLEQIIYRYADSSKATIRYDNFRVGRIDDPRAFSIYEYVDNQLRPLPRFEHYQFISAL